MRTTHLWGDEDFDWEGLNDAINFITRYLRRYRMGVHSKEKWGRADISVSFGISSLHELIWPGYCFRQWGKHKLGDLLWRADIYFWPRVFAPLNVAVLVPLHKYAYCRAYMLASRRWPHLINEVAGNADFIELLDKRLQVS